MPKIVPLEKISGMPPRLVLLATQVLLEYGLPEIFSTAGALRIGSPGGLPSNHPLIAFEHLSLYIQKHLGQSVAVYATGILCQSSSVASSSIAS